MPHPLGLLGRMCKCGTPTTPTCKSDEEKKGESRSHWDTVGRRGNKPDSREPFY